ncbi:hypothetical protein BVC80_1707g82 [Macleaya cordata]|uniref:Uncharacterized protein n=1 Tax=Macleaya cordata TaxID=56857 RepID=A0A200Q6G4_MACCD|nr:hypothetical protein BVC80_1707g82 [Macleaya cordata]
MMTNTNGIIGWNFNFSRRLYDNEVGEVSDLLQVLHNFRISGEDEDTRIWVWTKNNKFTVRSAYANIHATDMERDHIWTNFIEDAGATMVLPESVEDLMFGWQFKKLTPRGTHMMEALPAAILWSVWLERNRRAFQGIEMEMGKLIIEIKVMAFRWVSVLDEFKNGLRSLS